MEKEGYQGAAAPPPYPVQPPYYAPQGQTPYNPGGDSFYAPPQGGQAILVQPGTTIILTQPAFGEMPCRLRCPHCHLDVTTSVRYETGMSTHLCALITCLLFCPLTCVPYCTDCTKDTVHECPNCKKFIGLSKK